jgi:hypothetical protein
MLRDLRATAGQGTFEAHVTVALTGADRLDAFRSLCGQLGVKCVVIELPHGQVHTQPMTSSYHRGTVQQAAQEVAGLAGALHEAGFAVNRVKLEAVTTNSGIPQYDDEARAMPATNYFEFHVKALLPAGADAEQLRALCQRHDAHLSRNALKKETDGRQERFLTQRAYGLGRVNAEARFERLISALEAAGYTLGNRLREYSIFDSNARVDAGWIDPPQEGHA